jgi:hypothetical protein
MHKGGCPTLRELLGVDRGATREGEMERSI